MINKRPVLSAAEIMEYEDLIIKIDREIEVEFLCKRIAFTPQWHNKHLARIKKKYKLTEEQENAVESFYDMWFANMQLMIMMGQPFRIPDIRNITLQQLQDACIGIAKDFAERNGIDFHVINY